MKNILCLVMSCLFGFLGGEIAFGADQKFRIQDPVEEQAQKEKKEIAIQQEQQLEPPATTIDIEQTKHEIIRSRKKNPHWFARASVMTAADPGRLWNGLFGKGVSVGYTDKNFNYDFSIHTYESQFQSVRLHLVNAADLEAYTTAESTRRRSDTRLGSMVSFGPGVGGYFKLLKSEKWVEMGYISLHYLKYSEPSRLVDFAGGLFSTFGGVGYRVDPFMVAFGLSYNVGYVNRTPTLEIEHNGYLPIQWWAFRLDFFAWLY